MNVEKVFYRGDRMPEDGGRFLKIKALIRHAEIIDGKTDGSLSDAADAFRTLREDAYGVDPLVSQTARKLERSIFNKEIPVRDELPE